MRKFFLISLLLCAALSWGKEAANTTYQMAGPYEVIARDGDFRSSKAGSERDMKAAREAAERGDTATARSICDAYAATLQRLDGHDAPLCAIQCYDLMTAMQRIKPSTDPETRRRWKAMIDRALIPMMTRFEEDSPYANGNWGAIVNRLRMACAIVTEDSALYRAAVDYYLRGDDTPYLSLCSGYDEQRCIRGLRFEHLKVNGRLLYDGMPDVPKWYHTADMVPAWIGPNVRDVSFTK